MKKIIFFFIVILLVYYVSCGKNDIRSKKLAVLQRAFSRVIENTIKRSIYKNVSMGIYIATVDRRYILYSRNSNRLYITASAFKIIPSAVALIKFGPDYRFETPLIMDGSIEGKVLKGNLYIKGAGDPSLMLDDLSGAVKVLKEKGIKK